jgi:hypothetical protein
MEAHLREHLRDARIYSVADANALVPVLFDAATSIKRLQSEMESLKEQIDDLEAVRGPQISAEGSAERGEYERYVMEFEARRREFAAQIARLEEIGAELKDPQSGLIDFYAQRAGGETVYLCWRLGEERIRFWHSLRGGFAGRRPIEEL